MRYVIALVVVLVALATASDNPPTNCDPTQTVACYR